MGPDGTPVSDVNAFLLHLASLGRSAYTVRSYAQGLAHFLDWLHVRAHQIDEVTPQVVEAYITDFSSQAKEGACFIDPHKAGQINLLTRKSAPPVQRQPRTSAPHKSLHVVGESELANVMGPNWLQFP